MLSAGGGGGGGLIVLAVGGGGGGIIVLAAAGGGVAVVATGEIGAGAGAAAVAIGGTGAGLRGSTAFIVNITPKTPIIPSIILHLSGGRNGFIVFNTINRGSFAYCGGIGMKGLPGAA